MKTIPHLAYFLFLTLSLTSCLPNKDLPTSPTPQSNPFFQTATQSPSILSPADDKEITSISSDEMRFLPIHTDLDSATIIDIPLEDQPLWIAGIPFDDGNAWAVALTNGRLKAFFVTPDDYSTLIISPTQQTAGTPLTIYSQDRQLFALTPPVDASLPTSPVLLEASLSKMAYIATNGDLVIRQGKSETRLPVNALPDSRIISDEQNRLLFLSQPSNQYTHGVLGDEIEATGITLVETNPKPKIINTISIAAPNVIEGIYPIWADINSDGALEIIVTLSNIQGGARIVAFREDGSLLAEGPEIGTGFRWRHQLMVAPFGKMGDTMLAVVRTPHIGGVVEFYRLNENKLEVVTEISGISTHSIGSRNLFNALAGDFDNDGQVELLAPDQSHTQLIFVGLDGVTIHALDLNAELVTNLALIVDPNSGLGSLAAGLSNNILRVWVP